MGMSRENQKDILRKNFGKCEDREKLDDMVLVYIMDPSYDRDLIMKCKKDRERELKEEELENDASS